MGLAAKRAGLPSPSKASVASTMPSQGQKRSLRSRFARGEVQDSPDLERILALPRREKPELDQVINELTFKLKKPHGTQTLREHQAWTLWEAPQVGGCLAPLATGVGKTLLGMLMPMCFKPILQSDGTYRPIRAVLFLPPDLKAQFFHEWDIYAKHWKLPNLAGGKFFTPGLPVVHVVAYSELSHTKSSALLEQIKPDLIMGDEISALRNAEAARTIRFMRFIAAFPDTHFCGWDASIVATGIADFWHLLAIALDVNSPAPLDEGELKKWALALDPSVHDNYWMPGALEKLCEKGEPVRSGFRRRLIDTRGVIASEENALDIPLFFRQRIPPKMPATIRDYLKLLRRKPADGGWKRPDGEVFSEMPQVVACARQLASGFYLRWRFPRDEPREVKDEWFLRRQNWNRELRTQLSNPRVHLDSPKLCENAAQRWFEGGCHGCTRGPREYHEYGCKEAEAHPVWESFTYLPWIAVEDTVVHETEVVWESDWLLEDAAVWAREAPGIVWVDHPEFGYRLELLTGFRYYGGGDESNGAILQVDGAQSIICSVEANKKGKNLQMYSRNLLISFPTSNATLEQVVGRTYRSLQTALEVTVDYYLHTPELENALEKAQARASFVKQVLGSDQKLCFGKFINPTQEAP